jgi:superfamily II RNA helicase
MDEFHYYSDIERGVAWQVPLLRLAHARFLLMSATMGDNPNIREGLEELTGIEVSVVRSTDRPVPLDFQYSEKFLHEGLDELMTSGRYPVYVVNFTQRDCAEMAQNLMSTNYCTKEEKREISEALKGFRFDSPYGKEIQRFIRHGVGLHHAGLLPKYRLLVEQLSQQGLLKVICGTDTLGVGVNVPIRTVLFSRLCKFDGVKTGVLSPRDFHQISGRAGRKGFDSAGSVVALAPEHVVENARAETKAGANPKKKRKFVKKKPPERNYAHWDKAAFEKLITSPPQPLESQFKITHGILLAILQGAHGRGEDGWAEVLSLIERCHSRETLQERLRGEAETYLESLKAAGVVEALDDGEGGVRLVVDGGLQEDFSLHQASSLYLLDILPTIQEQSSTYSLDVITLVEAILENPRVVLLKQLDKIKGEKVNEMKAAGVPYDERMEELEKIDYPKPNRDFIYMTFNDFAETRPWVKVENIRPKSIGREMYERFLTFADYIQEYGLQRSEGVLLRYVSRLYKTLSQTIPDEAKDESVLEAEEFFRTSLSQIDSSLLKEWEELVNPAADEGESGPERPAHPTDDMRLFRARVRTEVHQLVRYLSVRDYERAAECVRSDGEEVWDASTFEGALESFYDDYETLVFDHSARLPPLTTMKSVSRELWSVSQILVDEKAENFWVIEAEVPLGDYFDDKVPLLRMRSVHD